MINSSQKYTHAKKYLILDKGEFNTFNIGVCKSPQKTLMDTRSSTVYTKFASTPDFKMRSLGTMDTNSAILILILNSIKI